MPGSFTDDVCDRERPAQRIAGYAVNCRDCTKMTDGRLVCTGRCFAGADELAIFDHMAGGFLALCKCDDCKTAESVFFAKTPAP